ncbi:MAG: GNAT family N-acetyltransferase [Paracoccaceae bacterium]
MILEASKIDFYNLSPILKLKAQSGQEHLVASNAITIAQGRYEPAGWVRGLWDGDIAIGLIAMITPKIKSPSFEEGDHTDAAYLWRLVIADEHQGKGYGAQAVAIAFQQTRVWGLPKLQTSVVRATISPLPFYDRQGLMRTGNMLDKEIELLADVPA